MKKSEEKVGSGNWYKPHATNLCRCMPLVKKPCEIDWWLCPFYIQEQEEKEKKIQKEKKTQEEMSKKKEEESNFLKATAEKEEMMRVKRGRIESLESSSRSESQDGSGGGNKED